jgi:hypothetical protein
MKALTPELMRERTAALFERVIAENGPVEEVIFEIVQCNGCGTIHNLLTGPPVGWTTSGDLDHGFNDLCRSCS